MKTKLLIDFDGTVFDTAGFKKEIQNIFIKSGYDKDEIEKTYISACMDYQYSIKEHYQKLLKYRKSNIQLTNSRIKYVFNQAKKYVYSDVEKFLTSVDRDKYLIILFTLGDVDFQRKKFESSLLGKYYDREVYTKIQKWHFLEQNELVKNNEFFIIIDDRGDTMSEISKRYKKALAIEINRGEKATDPMEKNSKYDGIQVKNLCQVLPYL